ncbi:hypothetical protein KUCAC02_017361, partial [Chaenocephalus aceratus]
DTRRNSTPMLNGSQHAVGVQDEDYLASCRYYAYEPIISSFSALPGYLYNERLALAGRLLCFYRREEMRLTDGARAALVSTHRFSHALRLMYHQGDSYHLLYSTTKETLTSFSTAKPRRLLPPSLQRHQGDSYLLLYSDTKETPTSFSTAKTKETLTSFSTATPRKFLPPSLQYHQGDSYLLLYSDTKETPTSFST